MEYKENSFALYASIELLFYNLIYTIFDEKR